MGGSGDSNQGGLPRRFVERSGKDRRQKKDWVVRSVTTIAVIGWICAVLAILLIDRASPSGQKSFFESFWNVNAIGMNTAMLWWAFIATLASFVISLAGFIFNAARHRRKTDRYSKLLIGIGIASTIIFVVFLVSFSGYL